MQRYKFVITALISSMIFHSCNISGPGGIFKKRSPHEQYGQKLTNAGLRETALGSAWFTQAENSLVNPLTISLPYKESGYFGAERPKASSLKFSAERGQRITISLEKKPAKNFTIYIDLWEEKNNRNKKLLAYADTNATPFKYDIDDSGTYLIRIQPELLSSGEYTLTITNGPSLAFPVKNGRIGSFWGAQRDNGGRRHEGIDIFAPRRTPALAAAEGIVNRVNVNKLGGKVVFMRPSEKNYTLYYAHLDEQLVKDGQKVKIGDTIGLVGNTGNAIHTSPHLHFGIYTFSGAIDPFNFVNPTIKRPSAVTASLNNIGKSVRTGSGTVNLRQAPDLKSDLISSLNSNTLMQVEAATANWYKVTLPDGTEGFVNSSSVSSVKNPMNQITIHKDQALFDKPENNAARKLTLASGQTVKLLGIFEGFYFVSSGENSGWIPANL